LRGPNIFAPIAGIFFAVLTQKTPDLIIGRAEVDWSADSVAKSSSTSSS